MPSLSGRTALVTGATRGIGLAIVRGLAQAGARIVVSSRKADAVSAVVEALRQSGHDAVGVPAHVGRSDDVARLAEQSVAAFGGCDIVVNNAAANPVFGPVQDTSDDAFEKIMAVNLRGPFQLCRALLPHLARDKGAIVNISSIGGVSPEQGLGIYSVSKAALISLTQVMAREWGPMGVRANVICPGLIKTDFSQTLWQDEKLMGRFLKAQPIPRIGEPEDVAGMAVFLASEAASYCTGGVYMVDGGYTV
ncbi:MAG: SDR family oxidoreductase [Gemmatimonadaceae bacterium]|nr:SDR family oxidoreductase [Gemmatimonadaceae bacterium]